MAYPGTILGIAHPARLRHERTNAEANRAGITEVRNLETDGVASALITNIAQGEAAIMCAPGLSVQRRRFAIAHQLGHFLLGEQSENRQCSNRDLAENRRDSPARKAEMQANRFAAGLLMPKAAVPCLCRRARKADGYGTANAADIYYMQMIKGFSPREIQVMFELVSSHTVLASRISTHARCREKFKNIVQSVQPSSIPTISKSIYDKWLQL